MSDIIDEIKEDIKRENLEKLWKKYGKYLITLAVAFVLTIGGFVWYKEYKIAKYSDQGEVFYEALLKEANGDKKTAITALKELSEKSSPSYQGVALLREAALLAEKGQQEEANKIYKKLSTKRSVAKEFRDLASLLYVSSLLKNKEISDEELKNVNQRLEELSKKGSPWRYSALEIRAFRALNNGKAEEALKYFKQISEDETAPESFKNRADEIIGSIEVTVG